MSLIKDLFCLTGLFKDNAIIGLSGLRKQGRYVEINIPESYKKTYFTNVENNYILI